MSFVSRWTWTNTIALFIAYLLYTPIAHGITGSHLRDLNPAQLVAHTIALGVVATIVLLAQRRALRETIEVTTGRIATGVVAFIAMFWIGYYLPVGDGPDWDILFAYLILGCWSWLGTLQGNGHRVRWMIAILAFPIASIVGEIAFFLSIIALGIEPNPHESFLQHHMFWLTVGTISGLVGGWIGGLCLRALRTKVVANVHQREAE